jgi:serine/threonine protein kinase
MFTAIYIKMGNQLSSSSREEINRLLLNNECFTQEGDPIDSNKIFTVVKLSPDSQNLILGKMHVKVKDLDVTSYKSKLDDLNQRLGNQILSHCLISNYWENSKFVIVIRQFCEMTLRKKLIRPPFLNETEKVWMIYQCLIAVQELHENKVFHGDIKTENFLVTSWNWVFLSDLGFYYKPDYLAEGDLTSYNLFFSSSERPACYLAPEKFASGGNKELTAEMDVFALGCVIAEIVLDGQCLFTLPELLSYKRAILKTPARLADIKDENIGNMVASMISLRPEERKHINYYLNWFKREVLTHDIDQIYAVIHGLYTDHNFSTAHQRISGLASHFYEIPWTASDTLLILAEFVTANIRSVNTGAQMVEALELLTDIGMYLSDTCKLHRVLPYIVSILQNVSEKAKVKATCMNSIVKLLTPLKNLTSRDIHLFDEYIWSALSLLINDESDFVKSELARLLPSIASIGRVFFDASCFHSNSSQNYSKALFKFSEKFIRIFKDLIVHKPENQIQVELLSNFADLSAYLDQQLVINNIIPMVLGWLNRGDSFRVLILSQIPRLLEVISTPDLFTQIFTCIEDGLSQHNELVVYRTLLIFALAGKIESHTLRKIITTVVHPNKWIRETVLAILTDLVRKMSPIDNFSILREILLDYIDLPRSSVELITEECLENIHRSFLRVQMARISGLPKLLKTLNDNFRIRESRQLPLLPQKENFKIFSIDYEVHSGLTFREDRLKPVESLSLRGNLIGCLNEHESSVSNILAIEAHQLLISASSDGVVKKWNFSRLDSSKSLTSENLFNPGKKTVMIKSLGLCNEEVFIAQEDQITFIDLVKTTSKSLPMNKLAKAIQFTDRCLATVEQGCLNIYDTRRNNRQVSLKICGFYGPVSCLCSGPTGNTLAVSTYSSALLIFDLRFASTSMIYYHSSGLPILTMQSFNSHSLLVGCEDIALLDLTHGVCTALLNSSSAAGNVSSSSSLNAGGSSFTVPSFRESFDNEWIVKNCYSISHRTRKTFESQLIVRKLLSPGSPYVFSAGNDCLVRCWDLGNACKSFCIGQDPSLKSRFREMIYPDLKVVVQDPLFTQQNVTTNKMVKRRDYQEVPNHRKWSHTDTILDLALVTQPRTLLFTASRDGTIKAWN